jgi:hypothetical protein
MDFLVLIFILIMVVATLNKWDNEDKEDDE